MVDTLYTNGVIAIKEKSLLGDRLVRLCELSAQDAFRALIEYGFGSGAEALSAADSELLCEAEARLLDDFIRQYSPSGRELSYLLSPRDFHNAKALVKAEKLGVNTEKLLAPEGMIPIPKIAAAIQDAQFDALGAELGETVKTALSEELTGAEIGTFFDRAMYKSLFSGCGRGILRKLLTAKVDMNNILIAFRASDVTFAEKSYIGGGKVSIQELNEICEGGELSKKSPYFAFFNLCRKAKEQGIPYTDAEKALESYEADYFYEKRFDLEFKEPFLYYAFRRRAEIANVRILLVCLNAGLKEQDIKKRLRAI